MGRVAVLGSGISGLVSAWLLSREHEVTLFEKEARLGGHTHSLAIDGSHGLQVADLGFAFFAPASYPNFTRLLATLDIPTAPAELSFAATGGAYPWNSRGWNGRFCERRHLLSPAFHRLWREARHFRREAADLLKEDGAEALALSGWLRRQGRSEAFQQNLLLPLMGAAWNTPPQALGAFPALLLARALARHPWFEHGTWRSLPGGAASYLPKLVAPLEGRVVLGARLVSVRRAEYGVYLHLEGQDKVLFDDVVFALPGDHVLSRLADPSAAERQVFGAFASQRTPLLLHRDPALMPLRRRAWAAYHVRGISPDRSVVTRLQAEDLYLTAHGEGLVDEMRVIARAAFEHPRFTVDALRAQGRWAEVSGPRSVQGRTHYAGAYWGLGFHEDGVDSALRVAECFGITWPGGA